MSKTTLYELADQYKDLEEMFYNEEVPEEIIFDSLAGIDEEIETKADNYAKLYKNMLADAKALKEEEDRLALRRRSLENRSKKLKDTLEENLRFIGKTKFKTTLFSYNIQKNGGLQPLSVSENWKDIPMEFLIPQDPIPNNEAIRTYLEENTATWAQLLPRGESLRIR